MVERSRLHRGVEFGHGLLKCCRIKLEFPCEFGDGGGADRRKQRRHEAGHDAGVEDDIGDLIGLGGDQPAPDRVALRPDILALVVKALGMLVDDDAEYDRVVAGDDAAVELRRAGIDRNRMALGGIADVLHPFGKQHFQDRAAVIGRAADQEIVGGLAPILLQPFDVGLEAAGSGDQRGRAHFGGAIDRLLERCAQEHAVLDPQIGNLGVIDNLDAELLGGQVQRVQHRATAAEEERIGATEAQRAAERGLPAHALFDDPVEDVLGLGDHELGELFVGLPAGQRAADRPRIPPRYRGR